MDTLFENYQPWSINNQCAKEDLILYEISGKSQEGDYEIRLWGKPLNSTRILNVRLVVHDIESEKFQEYSKALFAELPACP